MTGRVIVGLVWLVIVTIVAGAWSAGVANGQRKARESHVRPAPMAAPKARPAHIVGTSSREDLYGNRIDAAVVDYGIDIMGELYERHNPQIEVPRLSAPST